MKSYKEWLCENNNWEQRYPNAKTMIEHLLLKITEGMSRQEKLGLMDELKLLVLHAPGTEGDPHEVMPRFGRATMPEPD